MGKMIKGVTIILHEKAQSGTDEFNRPIYTEKPIEIENVLICPVSTSDITSELQLSGKKAEYQLCIPKKDAHIWEDCKVTFFDMDWQTFGFAQQLIEKNVPLRWNKIIKVERYE